jgi:hypothetical protein
MFNNVIEQFHYYKVHFHFKLCSVFFIYRAWIFKVDMRIRVFAQIIKRIKVRNVTIVMEEVHGINLLSCASFKWLLFSISSDSIWFLELNTLKCKPADDSKALILSKKLAIFFVLFLAQLRKHWWYFSWILLWMSLSLFFCFSFVFWKKSRKE